MDAITNVLIDLFRWMTDAITGNFGWTIVIFTLILRLLTLPVDIRSRVGMRRYSEKLRRLQPQMEKLNAAYKEDPQTLQRKTMELRKAEGVGMLPPGCLPQLLIYPLLLLFFAVFRNMAMQQTEALATAVNAAQASGGDVQGVVNSFLSENSWLWVRNIWMPDNAVTTSGVYFVRAIPLINGVVADVLPSGTYLAGMFTGDAASVIANTITPAWNLIQGMVPARNGLFIMPVLAAAVQYFTLKISQKMNPQPAQPGMGNQQAQSAGKMNKFMGIFFPILFGYFCLTSSTALAIYWITSSLLMMVINIIINKVLDWQDKKKQEKGLVI